MTPSTHPGHSLWTHQYVPPLPCSAKTAENDLLLRPLEPSEAERKLIAAKKQLRTARAEARHYKENLEVRGLVWVEGTA